MANTRDLGRFLWQRWHTFREEARRNEWTDEVFSDAEKERFDLEEGDPGSSGKDYETTITGEQNRHLGVSEPYDGEPKDERKHNPRRA